MSLPGEPDLKAAHNEKTKATANYLNGIAGGLFAAGVIAPGVAAVFGVAGAFTTVPALTLVGGHDVLRRQRRRSLHGAPGSRQDAEMTDVQIVAFIVVPLMGLVTAWIVFWLTAWQDARNAPADKP